MVLHNESQGVHLADAPVNVVCGQSPVSALVIGPALTIPSATTLGEAARVMEEAGVSALVLDDGGIVTERDLVRGLGHGASTGDTVAGVATPHPVVVPGSMTVVDACVLMLSEHVRHLVVGLGDEIGVVSMRDIAAVLLQTASPQIWLTSLQVSVDMPSEVWLG